MRNKAPIKQFKHAYLYKMAKCVFKQSSKPQTTLPNLLKYLSVGYIYHTTCAEIIKTFFTRVMNGSLKLNLQWTSISCRLAAVQFWSHPSV